jgi:hypothetical protein
VDHHPTWDWRGRATVALMAAVTLVSCRQVARDVEVTTDLAYTEPERGLDQGSRLDVYAPVATWKGR